MPRSIVTLITLLVSVVPASVFAQDANEAEDRAFSLFETSQERYNEGDFDEAVRLLNQAYAIHPEPVLLYNLGRAHESAGNSEAALDAYRRFLEAHPTTEDRGAIEARIQSLQEAIEERHRLQEERQRLESVRRDSQVPIRGPASEVNPEGAWTLVSVGALALGAGVVLGVLSTGARDDAQDAATHLASREEFEVAENLALGANVAFVGGGAILAAGLIWLILEYTSGADESDNVRGAIGLGRAAIWAAF